MEFSMDLSIKVFDTLHLGKELGRLDIHGYLGTTVIARAIVQVIHSEKLAWIKVIYTVPGFRGRGHASRLIEYLEDNYDLNEIRLVVCPIEDKELTKEQLIEFYAGIGFELIDAEKDLMAKDLTI